MTDLYRHFNEAGDLLYVGISLSCLGRLGQHRSNSKWYDSICTVKIEKCIDRSDALEKELIAIRTEKPVYNTVNKLNSSSVGIVFSWDCFDVISTLRMTESSSVLTLFLVLVSNMDDRNILSYKQGALADLCGFGTTTLKKGLSRLKDLGYITSTRTRGSSIIVIDAALAKRGQFK